MNEPFVNEPLTELQRSLLQEGDRVAAAAVLGGLNLDRKTAWKIGESLANALMPLEELGAILAAAVQGLGQDLDPEPAREGLTDVLKAILSTAATCQSLGQSLAHFESCPNLAGLREALDAALTPAAALDSVLRDMTLNTAAMATALAAMITPIQQSLSTITLSTITLSVITPSATPGE